MRLIDAKPVQLSDVQECIALCPSLEPFFLLHLTNNGALIHDRFFCDDLPLDRWILTHHHNGGIFFEDLIKITRRLYSDLGDTNGVDPRRVLSICIASDVYNSARAMARSHCTSYDLSELTSRGWIYFVSDALGRIASNMLTDLEREGIRDYIRSIGAKEEFGGSDTYESLVQPIVAILTRRKSHKWSECSARGVIDLRQRIQIEEINAGIHPEESWVEFNKKLSEVRKIRRSEDE